ncbi:MAG: ABC transporter substrate-binding protein [Patescibacteria group bacterium]|nr:ABC transporter substrate-binding protein [Patescibacteria group bacterium]
MGSILKVLFDLRQSIKSFVIFWHDRINKLLKISNQKNLDKKMVADLNGKKTPNWKQFKRFPKTLSQTESLLVKIAAALIIVSLAFVFYFDFWSKLVDAPKNGGEFTEGLVGSPLYINPILSQSYADADMDLSRLIFSGLLKYNEKLEIVPDLAEKYEISADQKTYTFYLKQNAKWHDGEKVTAADVIFTIQSIQNPDFKSPLMRSYTGIVTEKVDDYTVKFTISEPYAAFLNLMTVGLLPQHLWNDIPAINARLAVYNQKPIGSGPYKFKSLIKEKSGIIKAYTLEKNKEFYGKVPYIDKIIFKFYPDYENAISGLTNKEVQSLGFLPKAYLKKFMNKRDYNLYNLEMAQYTAVFFNDKNNTLLDNAKIRQALAYAVDKNKIIDDILLGQGQKIDGPILPGFLGYNTDIKTYEYDPKKALELLAADGWVPDGEVLKKNKQELKIKLTTVEQDENIKVANMIKDFWNAIGVNVELQIVSSDKIESEVITPRNYQALLYGEITGYDSDLFPFWHSSQRVAPGVNLANYANKKVDQLLSEARTSSDQSAREQKYKEMQNLIIDDLPAVFLYSPTYTYPVSKNIKGISAQKIATPSDRFIDIENFYIKTKKKFVG